MEHVENIGLHYYQTLRYWRKNFLENQRYGIDYKTLFWSTKVLASLNLDKIAFFFFLILLFLAKSLAWDSMTSSLEHGNIILIIARLVSSRILWGITRWVSTAGNLYFLPRPTSYKLVKNHALPEDVNNWAIITL